MSDLFFTAATLVSGEIVDIEVRGGKVASIGPSGGASPRDCPSFDLAGRLLLPSLVEPHAHLDKAFLADRVLNETGDLMGAIVGLQQVRHTLTPEDTIERATRAVRLMSRNGVTSIRTHADTTLDNGLESVSALCRVRERCADFMDIQVCALVEWPLSGAEGASRRSLARDALDAGADVLGGCPHLDPDPRGALEFLVDLALTRGVPLDVHADENLRRESTDLEFLAEMLLSDGVSHPVTASHCVSLSVMDESRVMEIAEKVREARISVIALPQTNLFLQGRENGTVKPRGIAPVTLLRRAGVTTAAGADNLQDPFNPMGRGDPLETAALMVMAGHVPTEAAFDLVTNGSRNAINRSAVEPVVGCRADFVSPDSTTLRESIAMASHDRIVVFGGRVIDDHIRNKK